MTDLKHLQNLVGTKNLKGLSEGASLRFKADSYMRILDLLHNNLPDRITLNKTPEEVVENLLASVKDALNHE